MKNLFRIFASVRSVHTTKTGRASEKSCHKLLLINGRILDPPPKSSGNVRFCFPDLTEVIRTFALKPVLQACQKCKTRTVTAALTGGCNTPKSLHRVAPCCTVLRAKNFQTSGATPPFSRRAGQVHGGTAGMRPGPQGTSFALARDEQTCSTGTNNSISERQL